MEIFVKVLGIAIGAVFVFFGTAFLVRGKKIVQAIQKRKFGKTSEPRKAEMIYARVLGILLILAGLYYAVGAILSLS